MAQYRKKPVVIETLQIPGVAGACEPFIRWAEEFGLYRAGFKLQRDGSVLVNTLEGTMRGYPGDWIIRGVAGEFYVCQADIFAATYEAV